MKIYIASDHAGFDLKQKLVEFLRTQDFLVEDLGSYELNPEDDYPDYIYPLALRVAQGAVNQDFGIIIGGTGQGEAMVANKVKGIRAAVFYGGSLDIIKLSKEHNDANVLSLGARFLTEDEAKQAVKLWLETKFSQDARHVRRIGKIHHLETNS